jgi:hypothetical protein
MNKKKIIPVIFGFVLLFLGSLWFLQGSDLVQIKPILCFADCEPITGKSTTWQIAGAVIFVAGASIIHKNLKKKQNG